MFSPFPQLRFLLEFHQRENFSTCLFNEPSARVLAMCQLSVRFNKSASPGLGMLVCSANDFVREMKKTEGKININHFNFYVGCKIEAEKVLIIRFEVLLNLITGYTYITMSDQYTYIFIRGSL